MLVECQCCNKEFNKNPNQIKKSVNHFCSRSCAAKINNKKFQKRTPATLNVCVCGKRIKKISKYCIKCHSQTKRTEANLKNIGDKIYNKHKYAKYSYIRYYAREIAKDNGMNSCKNCGYTKCFEICHIKPIHTYPQDTLISEVNEINNLIALCPNCHWEFDHGDLTIDQINGAAETRTQNESLKGICFAN